MSAPRGGRAQLWTVELPLPVGFSDAQAQDRYEHMQQLKKEFYTMPLGIWLSREAEAAGRGAGLAEMLENVVQRLRLTAQDGLEAGSIDSEEAGILEEAADDLLAKFYPLLSLPTPVPPPGDGT